MSALEVIVLALCVVGPVVLLLALRHRHRWTAWSDRVVTRDGQVLQVRRCKDSACNLQQIKDITP